LLETAYTNTVTACTVCTTSTEIQAKDLHERLGHVNDDCMRLTAKHLGWEITGVLDVCEACAVGKAKQKSIPKSVDTLYSRPDELMFIDIAGFQQPSKGGKRFWILFVDTFSKCSVSRFARYKSELPDIGFNVMQELQVNGLKWTQFDVIMLQRTNNWRQ
jgi:hypothetical protein